MNEDSTTRELARRILLTAVWVGLVLVATVAAAQAMATGGQRWLTIVAVVAGGVVLLAVFAQNVDLLFGLAFASLAAPTVIVPGLRLPANEILLTVALVVALIQQHRVRRRIPPFVLISLAVLLAMLTISMALNDAIAMETLKRIAHVVVFGGIILVLAAGLIPRDVIRKGALFGITASSALGLLWLAMGRTPHGYTGRLTGAFGDPNVAGMTILVLGALSIEVVPRGWRRNILTSFLLLAFVLTLSRSSYLALAFCVLWWFIGRRMRLAGGLSVLAGATFAFSILPSTVQQMGIFSGRAGSDALRNSVLAKSIEAAGSGFLFGHGPGSTRVLVRNSFNMFFHNSYLAAISEGGFVTLAALVALVLGTFGSIVTLPRPSRQIFFEMALIAVAVMAFHLGEVLLDLVCAATVGVALSWLTQVRSNPWGYDPATGPLPGQLHFPESVDRPVAH